MRERGDIKLNECKRDATRIMDEGRNGKKYLRLVWNNNAKEQLIGTRVPSTFIFSIYLINFVFNWLYLKIVFLIYSIYRAYWTFKMEKLNFMICLVNESSAVDYTKNRIKTNG